MCKACWREYGSPQIVNKKVIKAVEAIKKVYEASVVAGACHVVLDDWNIESDFVDGSFEDIDKNWAVAGERAADLPVYVDCLRQFQGLTVDERASALALYNGFFKSDTALNV